MKIKVEACWGGNDHYYFRLTLPDGSRESINAEKWTRATASLALDRIQRACGVPRKSVRFEHR